MNRQHIKTLALIFLILAITGCDMRQYYQARRSVRRTQSQVQSVYRDVDQVKELFGGKSKGQSKQDSAVTAYYAGMEPVSQKNMLNRYGYIYDCLNTGSGGPIKADNFYWDSVNQVYYVKNENVRKLDPSYEVFGWHPYWMGDAWKSYAFDLLSTLAYYAYKVDPASGSYANPKQISEWKTTALLDSAKAKNTRVLLTIANHGAEQNRQFLNNPAAWSTLIDSVASLVNTRSADGVDINFEGIPYRDRWAFVQFVEELRQGLNLKVSGSVNPFVSLTLPAGSNRESYEVKSLARHVDLLVIMGYEYNGESHVTGAVSPLRSSSKEGLSLQSTFEYYTNAGLDPKQSVLALPYYGSQWSGTLNAEGLYDTYFDRDITFREVMSLYSTQYTPNLDVTSMTKYYFIEFQDSTSTEVWFDDAYTLKRKYDFALSREFKGIGIWALGYDNGYTDLWDLLNTTFTSDTIAITDPIAAADGYPIKISRFVLRYRDVFMVSFLMFALAAVAGLVISFNDWRVRESLFGVQIYRYTVLVVITLLIIPLISLMDWFSGDRWKLLIAFVAGGICFVLMSRLSHTLTSKRP